MKLYRGFNFTIMKQYLVFAFKRGPLKSFSQLEVKNIDHESSTFPIITILSDQVGKIPLKMPKSATNPKNH